MWRGRPINELSYVPEDNFPDLAVFRNDFTEDKRPEALLMPR